MTTHDRDPQSPRAVDIDAATLHGPWSRRSFLTAAGVGGATLAAFTATGGFSNAGATVASRARTQSTTTASSAASADAKTVAFAASLEVLAIATYKAALAAATAGSLGPVPPAGATFVQTAITQHQAQLDTLNSVLTAGGAAAVTAPDPKLKASVDTAFAKVTDFAGAAELARSLEETAAATYLKAIPTLDSKDARALAGSIQIIDAQHVAILNYVLGEYPVPDVFAKTDMAASP